MKSDRELVVEYDAAVLRKDWDRATSLYVEILYRGIITDDVRRIPDPPDAA
jgi:hypothetical protein